MTKTMPKSGLTWPLGYRTIIGYMCPPNLTKDILPLRFLTGWVTRISKYIVTKSLLPVTLLYEHWTSYVWRCLTGVGAAWVWSVKNDKSKTRLLSCLSSQTQHTHRQIISELSSLNILQACKKESWRLKLLNIKKHWKWIYCEYNSQFNIVNFHSRE